jgi:hypothetical protein
MVEAHSEEEEFDFEDAADEHDNIQAENALNGVKARQSYFVGAGGPHKILDAKKDSELGAFNRGDQTAADALKLAS